MRIVRFQAAGSAASAWGIDEGDRILPLAAAPWETGGDPVPAGDPVTKEGAELLVPVVPGKILCIGRNYRAHVAEMGNEVPVEPLVFMKPASSLLASGGTVVLPPESARVDFEGELALVISRRGRRIPADEALSHVYGVVPALDVSARDLQKKDGQWWRAKGFDTFCPVGPAIGALHGAADLADLADLGVETRVNGAVRQSGTTSQLIFDVATVVSWCSQAMTLEPGDLILTGTPEGVGPLAEGDEVEVRVGGLPPLRVRVRKE
jgi:2-keto-4-pentenoate hydratase/2-oxohepta-3-ene-1,7-dioic acid hydratase in catechol pathway